MRVGRDGARRFSSHVVHRHCGRRRVRGYGARRRQGHRARGDRGERPLGIGRLIHVVPLHRHLIHPSRRTGMIWLHRGLGVCAAVIHQIHGVDLVFIECHPAALTFTRDNTHTGQDSVWLMKHFHCWQKWLPQFFSVQVYACSKYLRYFCRCLGISSVVRVYTEALQNMQVSMGCDFRINICLHTAKCSTTS